MQRDDYQYQLRSNAKWSFSPDESCLLELRRYLDNSQFYFEYPWSLLRIWTPAALRFPTEITLRFQSVGHSSNREMFADDRPGQEARHFRRLPEKPVSATRYASCRDWSSWHTDSCPGTRATVILPWNLGSGIWGQVFPYRIIYFFSCPYFYGVGTLLESNKKHVIWKDLTL